MRTMDQWITWLLTIAFLVALFVSLAIRLNTIEDKIGYADIAGATVPAVHCQEDEVIWWTGPDALGCVHFEEVK